MGKITLISLSPEEAQYARRRNPSGYAIFVLCMFALQALVMLSKTGDGTFTGIVFAVLIVIFLLLRRKRKILYSIVFDPAGNIYEIGFATFNGISTVHLKKEEVKLNVREDVSARYWGILEIQIVYRRKDYFFQQVKGPWTNEKMRTLEEAIKQLKKQTTHP